MYIFQDFNPLRKDVFYAAMNKIHTSMAFVFRLIKSYSVIVFEPQLFGFAGFPVVPAKENHDI